MDLDNNMNNVENNNQQIDKKSTWEILKQARQFQKEQERIKREEKRKLVEQRKAEKKQEKQQCDQEIKKIKIEIKNLTIEHKKQLKTLKQQYRKSRSNETVEQIQKLNDDYHHQKAELTDKIWTITYDFGKKYKTLIWNLKKGLLGIKKEFNRVVWSRPVSTFKYLSIIIVIIGLLSLIFFVITIIVDYI